MESTPEKLDRGKSILKLKDPESEQLLPRASKNSPVKKPKGSPVKFIGVGKMENDKTSNKRAPCSPLPLRKVPIAPLADLLADFDGQENSSTNTSDDDTRLNDALLDQQNANTTLRCSRQTCKLNSPAQSSIIQDPLIAPFCSPLCVCGATMTRVPVESTAITNKPRSSSESNFSVSLTSTISTDDTITLTSTAIDIIDESSDAAWPSTAEDLPKDRISSNRNFLNDQDSNNVHENPSANINEEVMLSTDNTPTEETKLIDEPYTHRPDRHSK